MNVTLVNEEGELVKAKNSKSALIGGTVSSLHRIKDVDNEGIDTTLFHDAHPARSSGDEPQNLCGINAD